MRPRASSATAVAFAPGVLVTMIPRAVAASRSTLSVPTPNLEIALSFGAISIISADKLCRPNTTPTASGRSPAI
ncbi:MAG: hypothetical protein BWY85_02170 [Firmicutes bacterium ADurb.Bin506]|nr:MAG: hypothetical protein BWY85_02170 [Firmicutes bacterium ADurb.Bin506]